MNRSALQKIIATGMLCLLFATVISKDLYHVFIHHAQYTADFQAHLSNPETTVCNDQQIADCYFCHFEFSAGDTEMQSFIAHQVLQLNSEQFLFTGQLHTANCFLSRSLRAPPAVI